MRRALLALESAQEINDNPRILPSYEVFFLNLIWFVLELMILNLFFPKNDSCVNHAMLDDPTCLVYVCD